MLVTPHKNRTYFQTGIDSRHLCINKEYFDNYPHKIKYVYNSRGFRDIEWPDNPSEAIWCVGDSFTVGIGCPVEHTWPYLLERLLGKRCINISLDGASNEWIAEQIQEIQELYNPDTIIAQWSYIHRYKDKHYLKEEIFNIEKQIDRASQNLNSVKNVIHSFIPGWLGVWTPQKSQRIYNSVRGSSWHGAMPKNLQDAEYAQELKDMGYYEDLIKSYLYDSYFNRLVKDLNYIPEIDQLDFARDSFHYDIKTATKFANDIVDKIKEIQL